MFLNTSLIFVSEIKNSEPAEARIGVYPIGLCSQIPDCNKKCLELHSAGGKCFKISPDDTEYTCGCTVNSHIYIPS